MSPIKLESYEFIGIDHLTCRRGAMVFHKKNNKFFDFQSYRKKYGWNIQQGTNFDALYNLI